MVHVSANTTDASALLAQLGELAPRAIARSLNRGIGAARTLLVREVARDTGIRVGDVREQVRLYEAKPGDFNARVETSLARIPVIKMGAKGPRPSRGKGRGVSWRSGTGTKRESQAFIATMASGHEGVFRREGKARLGIIELFGPSLGHVFLKYEAQGIARAEEQFSTTLLQELKFRTRSQG